MDYRRPRAATETAPASGCRNGRSKSTVEMGSGPPPWRGGLPAVAVGAEPFDGGDDLVDAGVDVDLFGGHGDPEPFFDGGDDLQALQGVDVQVGPQVGLRGEAVFGDFRDPGNDADDLGLDGFHARSSPLIFTGSFGPAGGRRLAGAELAGQVSPLALLPPHLAAGRARNHTRPHEEDFVGAEETGVVDAPADLALRLLPRLRLPQPGLGRNDDARLAAVLDAERDDALAADPRHVLDLVLQVLRIVVAAVADDDVLAPAR